MDSEGTSTGNERLSPTRRAMLGAVSAGAATLVGGCLGLSDGGSSNETPSPAADLLPPPRRGSADAPVTVSVFIDFACPHCRSFHRDVVPMLDDEYVSDGVVTYEHRDFPLPVDDPESYRAANAARAVQAARGDEAFFASLDGLLERQADLGLSLYESIAEEADADPETVRAAAEGRVYANSIDRDISTGEAAGIDSTPSVLVDGDRFEGETWGDLADRIEAARSERS